MALQRLSPQDARAKLAQLIQQSMATEPNLAQKLTALAKWIKDKKDGQLRNKSSVLDLLTEVIADAELWLALRSMSPEERQQFYAVEHFLPTEQYWLEVLLPSWINDRDPKFPRWKQEVMKGNFERGDEPLLRNLAREIEGRGGSYLWRHLLDLSMATDLLVSGQNKASLCVQLTTLSGMYLTDKQQEWEATLQHWCITWGLLVSYDPTDSVLVSRLVTVILSYSDASAPTGYNIVTNL